MTDVRTGDMLDALLAIPRLGASEVSRDGQWVAWTWFGAGEAADVFAAPTDGSAPPVRLTNTSEETILVSFSPDNRSVIVAQDRGGDERYALYQVALSEPGMMVPLTEEEPPYFLRGGDLHPGGLSLFYAMNFDVERGEEIEPSWIYRHDLATGVRTPLARPLRPAYNDPELNDAGTHILYERQDLDPAGTQIWLVDVEGREDREILNVGADKKVSAAWLPDSRRVLALAETGTHRRLEVLDLESGERRTLIDDPARNIEDAYVLRGTEQPTVAVVEVRDAVTSVSLLDVESGEETPFEVSGGTALPLRAVDGGWIATYYSSTHPGDIVRLDGGPPVSLTGLWNRTPLTEEMFVPGESFHWRSGDGRQIQGWLYRPVGEARGTIVLVHGGPTAHTEAAFNTQVQYYLSRGFHVLQPNYRGSTGFGLEFQESIKADGWGGREQDDIRSGIEALIERGIARPARVGITGTSYGGYSSWCGITRWPRATLAAAAPICGMTDLVVDYETTRPDLRPYSEEMMGGSPQQVPERYRLASPINFVRNIQGDLLIVQGLRDPNVTPENVNAVRAALDEAQVPYEVLAFEDEGHGIVRPANQKVLYRRLADFFQHAFGP
ncbi:MAG TPA: prolyl oligopeptidase family serine peptidase [Chloroflexota bacterium]|nr:prolyl oligopeptidase family serine peptidase [Chloroflexota bacterium]